MKRNILTVWVLTATLLIVGETNSYGQTRKDPILTRQVTVQLEKRPLWELVVILMTKYDAPVGFEQSTYDNDHYDYVFRPALPWAEDPTGVGRKQYGGKSHLISLNVVNGTVEDVLEELIPQMEFYRWEVNDGVINIIPSKGRDDRYRELLELRVEALEIFEGFPQSTIREQILALPAVNTFLNQNGLHVSSTRLFLKDIFRPIPSTIDCRDLTLREVLNKVAATTGGGWVLKYSADSSTDDNEFLEIEV